MDSQSWTALGVIFYVATLLPLTLYVFFVRRASPFEPVSLFIFFVSLFALPLPVRYCFTTEIEGNVSPNLSQFAPYLCISLVMTAIALVVFVSFYYSRWARRLGDCIPQLPDHGARGAGVGILTLVLVSVVLIYFLAESVGGVLAFLLLGYKSSEETFGRGYLAVGFPWLVVAMLALLDRYATSKKWRDAIWGLVLLAVNFGIFALTGNRAMIMYMAISLVIFIHLRIRRLTPTIFLPLAMAGFIGLNVMGTLRGSDYGSVDEFVERLFASSEAGATDSHNFFYTLTIGEFVVPFETLPQMVRSIGVDQWPWLGLSYLRAPVYMIPSFIFPDRPLPLANWYMENFYGGGYGLNEGRQFFFLAEGYLNWGAAGVFFIAAVWGIGWGALHRWMVRGRDRFGTVLIYSLLTAFMFRCIAGDIVTLLVGTTQQSLAAVFIVLAIAYLFAGRRRAGKAVPRLGVSK
jgi:hypothetical protein